MSKAFYPTNDGHVGNLFNLSMIELKDLITRQENLLKKRKFLNSLPDKGEKIKKHLEQLQHELSTREGNCTASALEKDNITESVKDHPVTGRTGNKNNSVTVNAVNSNGKNNLESDFQKLVVTEDTDEISEKLHSEKFGLEKTRHQYEIALEKAERNLQSGLKQPLKLNRALKIEHVEDLPEEIKRTKQSQTSSPEKILTKKTLSESEESAAVPPHYKFSAARMIDLQESLQLQEQQKQLQEELHAELAAEKLAERLHIKTERYNPEGIDMSYRSSREQAANDSDDENDDVYENAGFSLTRELSDTDD